MKIGIALVPDEKFIGRFVSLQERARSFLNLTPGLGTDRNLPHLTLVQGHFSDRVDHHHLLTGLLEAVKAEPVPLVVTPLRFVYLEPGWYFLAVEPTRRLRELHDRAFELSRASLMAPVDDGRDRRYRSPLERENYLRHGYRYIGEAFYPHFTLGRCLDDCADAVSRLNELLADAQLEPVVPIDRLTVYLMGGHGAHQETLHSVKVSN
ncbi:MAG TPA: DUF1045 domain-containing protein [Blastocatellia bacterium]|nr:DUF1045 domain-containing protein [Blastocatellia bacterium]